MTTLLEIALGLLAGVAPESAALPELVWLRERRRPPDELARALAAVVVDPLPADGPLVALGRHLGLTHAELLTASLAAAVETELMPGRALARLQHPVGAARPTLGLLARAFAPACPEVTVPALHGAAIASGLLRLLGDDLPLPERAVTMPRHLVSGLRGHDATPTGALEPAPRPVPLPPSLQRAAEAQARALTGGRALVLRCAHAAEGETIAAAIAAALGRRALFLDPTRTPEALVPVLLLGSIPVFVCRPAPGERVRLPALPGYRGPVLALAGPEGAVETPAGPALSWVVPIPGPEERAALWTEALGDPALAATLSVGHRHRAGRIDELGRLARHEAAVGGRQVVTEDDVRAAAWLGEGQALSALAQPVPGDIPDAALVLPGSTRGALSALVDRCLAREGLVGDLGEAAIRRYVPGVRALFYGPPGTGKTQAAGWLATRLGMPLFRVDAAAVTSKYIGETEKNLSELLARAEHAEVVLLFDEADSIFGKRTDVRHSTDRFANAQTNYLLQRIETYEGIVLLTSNTKSRFDEAFMRRLDVVLEFQAPGPEERRSLWRAHLGDGHGLDPRQVNRLSAAVDLAGGHVRNVVLTAAVRARRHGRPIVWEDVLAGLEVEYRKLARPMPAALATVG